MKLIAACFLLAAPPLASISPAQNSAGRPAYQIQNFHVDSCQKTGLESLKGHTGTIVGRVISARMEQDKLLLVLDGGKVGVLVSGGKPDGWTGKLIETNGLLTELSAKSRDSPPLVIQQPGQTKVRVFEENLDTLSSVLLQESQPELSKGHPVPPLPLLSEAEVAAEADLRQVNSWMRKDRSSVKSAFHFFTWRQRLAPDMKTRQWVVCLDVAPPGTVGQQLKYPEDLKLTPEDEARLRRMLWKDHYEQLKSKPPANGSAVVMVKRAADPMVATVDWLDRLEAWGSQPPVDDPALQRLPGPADFGNLPDLRQLTAVELTKASPQQRLLGKLQLLDWGMTGEATAEQIMARIRWEDGLEEVVPALTIFPRITYNWGTAPYFSSASIARHEVCLLFMKDWAQARRAGQPLPGAELKLRALRQFLHCWWGSSKISRPNRTPAMAKAELQQADEARRDAQRRSALFQDGHKLPFPGLPPRGYKILPNDQADRSLIMAWQDELGGTGLNGCIPELASTLRWWADCNVIQLPERMRDGKRRDTMLLAAVQRYPTVGKVQEYMLENTYAMQVFTDSDYSPGNLARYAVGCHAVALDIDIWNEKKKVFRQRMLIHTAAPDGAVVFSIWGQKGTGRFKAVSLRDGGKRPSSAPVDVRECYQLEVSGPVELTDYLAKNEFRFVLDDWSMGHVTVMTPWIKDSSVPAIR